jgi:hypothetical protein
MVEASAHLVVGVEVELVQGTEELRLDELVALSLGRDRRALAVRCWTGGVGDVTPKPKRWNGNQDSLLVSPALRRVRGR